LQGETSFVMNNIKKITIIGAGCVAKAFAKEFYQRQYIINEIVSRRKEEASKLAESVNARAVTFGKEPISEEADLYIVSVKDDAITDIRKNIRLNNKLVVHTSGSLSMESLKKCSTNYGILYPLQTFSKEREVRMADVPFFINSNTPEGTEMLHQFAKTITESVYILPDEKLSHIHLSAVFASNFTNFLLKISKDILDLQNVDFKILEPLVKETMSKAFATDPSTAQTGPAKRGDCNITDKHKEMLKRKDWRALYVLFSGMIREEYSSKKSNN